jgi:hypothetical protein
LDIPNRGSGRQCENYVQWIEQYGVKLAAYPAE